MTSSSPSPLPVRLSPRCSIEPSGERRLLKNTVIIGQHLLVRAERDGAGVEVEVGAGGGPDVPAEADRDRGEARASLVSDISALARLTPIVCIAFVDGGVVKHGVMPTSVVPTFNRRPLCEHGKTGHR